MPVKHNMKVMVVMVVVIALVVGVFLLVLLGKWLF